MVAVRGTQVDQKSAVTGVAGGLAGGVVFGFMMHSMDMLPMVAMLVGSEAVAVGWILHLAISAFIGATFGLLFGSRVRSVGSGVLLGGVYGAGWWVLGPLLIMPGRLGMELFMINEMTQQSLMGHLLFGVILGAVFAVSRTRLSRS